MLGMNLLIISFSYIGAMIGIKYLPDKKAKFILSLIFIFVFTATYFTACQNVPDQVCFLTTNFALMVGSGIGLILIRKPIPLVIKYFPSK